MVRLLALGGLCLQHLKYTELVIAGNFWSRGSRPLGGRASVHGREAGLARHGDWRARRGSHSTPPHTLVWLEDYPSLRSSYACLKYYWTRARAVRAR